jgi:hypothetical protein
VLFWGAELLLQTGKILILITCIIAGLTQFTSYAHAQSNSISATPKNDEKKSSKEQKKATQAVAQGLSIAESMLLSESPWGIFFNATATRGLDEYADTWSSENALSLSYRIDDKSALGMSIGYETLIYENGGSLFNNTDRDPDRFGLTDLDISYTRPNIWSNKYSTLVWTSTLTFPSSRLSQRNSLTIEGETRLALRFRPNAKLMLTPSLGTYYREYRYDTANTFGTIANSPFGITYGLSGAYTFSSLFIGTLFYGQTQRYDFFNDWRTIQTAVAQLNANVTNTLNLSAGYRYRDRTVSNDPLFDDDRSIYYIGVGYVF